jgi:hypothetical protein
MILDVNGYLGAVSNADSWKSSTRHTDVEATICVVGCVGEDLQKIFDRPGTSTVAFEVLTFVNSIDKHIDWRVPLHAAELQESIPQLSDVPLDGILSVLIYLQPEHIGDVVGSLCANRRELEKKSLHETHHAFLIRGTAGVEEECRDMVLRAFGTC